MWTKNWHRFLQGIYGACKSAYTQVGVPDWAHDTEGLGETPRVRAYAGVGLNYSLKWCDVITNCILTTSAEQYLATPDKGLIKRSQLDIDSITYMLFDIAQGGGLGNYCQLGNGQATDDYTAYKLASPITSGFTVQNIISNTVYDSTTKKHKRMLNFALVNSSYDPITVSEFGIYLTFFSHQNAAVYVTPALMYYEKFSPVTIAAGDIFRIVIEQEIPVLEVTTQ